MNILIVEDDPSSANLLKKNSEIWGYQVEVAASGSSALQKVKQMTFDLVLLDIFLPDYHGVDLISQFKSIQHDMGIIAMTGHNSRELELKIREQGIFYYLIKPFDMNSLKTILVHITNKKFPAEKEKPQGADGDIQTENGDENHLLSF